MEQEGNIMVTTSRDPTRVMVALASALARVLPVGSSRESLVGRDLSSCKILVAFVLERNPFLQ